MSNLFEINFMGRNSYHPNGIYIDRPNGTDNHLFLFIKSKCRLLVNNELMDITEPCFILYDLYAHQLYYNENEPYSDDWIHFSYNDAHSFFNNLDIPFNTPMFIMGTKDISNMINDLNTEYLQRGPHHNEIIDMKLRTLFYKFSDIYHTESSFSDKMNRYRQTFNEIRNKIYDYESFDKDNTVGDIAAALNLSTSYFQHIYKELFGVSVMQDIIKSRIDYACYLLQNNYDSITDIAFRCGYENKEHFTRQFKLVTGYTPKKYREISGNAT